MACGVRWRSAAASAETCEQRTIDGAAQRHLRGHGHSPAVRPSTHVHLQGRAPAAVPRRAPRVAGRPPTRRPRPQPAPGPGRPPCGSGAMTPPGGRAPAARRRHRWVVATDGAVRGPVAMLGRLRTGDGCSIPSRSTTASTPQAGTSRRPCSRCPTPRGTNGATTWSGHPGYTASRRTCALAVPPRHGHVRPALLGASRRAPDRPRSRSADDDDAVSSRGRTRSGTACPNRGVDGPAT